MTAKTDAAPATGGLLGRIEWLGNKLPDPATLFLVGTLLVMALSAVAVGAGWEVVHELPRVQADGSVQWQVVQETVVGADGAETLQDKVSRPTSLLTGDGLFWLLSTLVKNFTGFAPLGVVLVGMLGIGLAERVGLIAVLLKYLMQWVPARFLTPAMVFLGVMSSAGIDAGYVVLPPLAAAVFRAAGRSPVAGIAAAFAGVSAGFNANLMITGLDPMLAGFDTEGARVLDPGYSVAATCNWFFAIASTFLITAAGWWTTSVFVERRLAGKGPDEGGPVPVSAEALADQQVRPEERRALRNALGAVVLLLGIFFTAANLEGWALQGQGAHFARWVEVIVPLLFLLFTVPSLVYGFSIGALKDDKGVAKMMIEAIAAMAPIIVLAFFAAQFIEVFKHSGLDRMAALAGGQALGKAELPASLLIVAFIGVTVLFNLFVGSMSAKYAMFAPIFIPMFMLVGISPELTQAAYRIGDSVSNIITPLNAYLVIVLVFLKKEMPRAGMGTLISTMLPYTVVFTIVWTIMLVVWMALGLPLGIEGPLEYQLPG